MDKELVSVIVPAYNVCNVIKKCIKSIIGQSYRPIEIIVINDGSTDNTLEILEYLQLKYDSLLKVINQNNMGVSAARNKGIQEAKGHYICFIDSDDEYSKDFISDVTSCIQNNKSEMTISAFYTTKNEQTIGVVDYIDKEKNLLKTNEFLDIMLNYHDQAYWGANWNKIYLSSIIKDNGIKFQKGISIGEDLYFNLQYLKHTNSIGILHSPNYKYKVDTAGSLSKIKRLPQEYWKQYKIIFHEYKTLCSLYNVKNMERISDFAKKMIFNTFYIAVANNRMKYGEFFKLYKEISAYVIDENLLYDKKTKNTKKIWNISFKLLVDNKCCYIYILIRLEQLRRLLLRG